ncbi:MAG TPA: penicillin-binding protein 2 [Kofleriaceae bacterium]
MIRGDSGYGPALPELHKRLRWLALFVIAGFALLVGRLWQLQVMRGESYYARTVSNVVKERYLPSVRGKILDSKGTALADNRPAFNIYATPNKLTPEAKGELERMLGLSDDEIAKIGERLAIGKKRDPKSPILVLEDQGRDRAALVEQARTRLPGVEVHHEPYRYYPQGDLAAHLIGYMTQMTAEEADRLTAQGYDTSDLVGRYGLESAWENYLRGKRGVEHYAVDARGQRLDNKTVASLIHGEGIVEPVPGANLILTIDSELQRVAEKAVARVAASAIVIVEVKTGRVRAMVSKPSFDPNIMTGHLTHAEYTLLMQDPRKPFIDKALRATYPPGSIFKFVTTLAALEDGQAAEDESMFCTGSYELSGTRFRCHGYHEKVDLLGAIKHSCDVYFWNLAQRIGLDRIAEVSRGFGLGAPTNLGLNGDSGGRIPTKAWYEKNGRYKIGYATNAAIGQGDVEVTVVQMAMAYASLANGGKLYVPQVVERVESYDGRTIVAYDPKVARTVKLPPDAADVWRRGMWKVNNEPGGTAYDHGYSQVVQVLGKTGTAEVKKHHKDADNDKDLERWNPNASHAWFAGWAPADDPELAIVVLVEHGGAGGTVAWPIAEKILATYFTRKQKGDAKAQPLPIVVPKKAPRTAGSGVYTPTKIPTRAMLKKQGERRKVAP